MARTKPRVVMLTVCAIWMGSAPASGAVAEAVGRGGGVREAAVNAPDTLVLDAYRAVVDLHRDRAEVIVFARFTPTPRLVPGQSHRVFLNWPEGAGNAAWQGVTAEIDWPGQGLRQAETRVVPGRLAGAGRLHRVTVTFPALAPGAGRERSVFALRLGYRVPLKKGAPDFTLPLRFLRPWRAPWSRIAVLVRLRGVRLAQASPAPATRLLDRLSWTLASAPRADLVLRLRRPLRRVGERAQAASRQAGCCAVGPGNRDLGLVVLVFGVLTLWLGCRRAGRHHD